MDTGIISTRYARAIYEHASEKGGETALYEEMKNLFNHFSAYPLLRKIMSDPVVSSEEKIQVLTTAAGVEASKLLKQVIRMIVKNGRANYMETIAWTYNEMYRKAKDIVTAHLTSVETADHQTEAALIELISGIMKDKTVEFHQEINSDIIGGFILNIDNNRLDASVLNQLKMINHQL